MLEMWIFWDGRILNYGLAGRSQNVLFNLYLLDTKIENKKIDILYSDPLPDLRPDLEASRYPAFAYVRQVFRSLCQAPSYEQCGTKNGSFPDEDL